MQTGTGNGRGDQTAEAAARAGDALAEAEAAACAGDALAEADRAPAWMPGIAALLAAWSVLWLALASLYLVGGLTLKSVLDAPSLPLTSGPMLGVAFAALAGALAAAWWVARFVRRRVGLVSKRAAVVWLSVLALLAYFSTPSPFVYTVFK